MKQRAWRVCASDFMGNGPFLTAEKYLCCPFVVLRAPGQMCFHNSVWGSQWHGALNQSGTPSKRPHISNVVEFPAAAAAEQKTQHTFGIWEGLWKKTWLVVMGFPVTSAACLWGQAHLFCLPFMRRSEVLIQATWWDGLQVRWVCLLSLLELHYNLRAVLTQHPAQAIPWVCDWQIIYSGPMTVDLFYDTSKTDKAGLFALCYLHSAHTFCVV